MLENRQRPPEDAKAPGIVASPPYPRAVNQHSAKYYRRARPELAELLPATYTRVLEIGCSQGNFRVNLDRPCEYWGVEPEPEAAAAAATKLDRVLNGLYEDVCDELPDAYFDLIICNDVIEHMPDHDSFLQAIQQKMTPSGRLVGSMPNVRFVENLTELLFDRDWRYRDEGILDRTHLRFFTRRSLQRSVRENGFEPECLFGRDTQYRQFGIRLVKPGNSGH